MTCIRIGYEIVTRSCMQVSAAGMPCFVAGNIAVTLHCATPGAAIHYTIDTTQPRESSPIYHAAIIMKNKPLTIKAFAESPGKKESAVVTGNFRINGD